MRKLGQSSWFIICLLTIAMIVPTSPTFAAGTLRPAEHPAKIVIGADDMNSISVAGCSANRFDFNGSGNWFAVTPDGKLLVADRQNHRVVVFNSIPTTNGANADYAIGQDNLDDRFLHRGNVDADNNPQPCAWGLYEPIAVAVGPNGQIAIGDRGNMRVVIYNKLPTKEEVAAKKPADLVLGQADFKTRGGNKTRWGLSDCEDVAFHGNDLVVCDREANRIMIWKDITKLSNSAAPIDADIVLGQKDWTTIDLPADQGGLQAPRGIAVGNNGEVIVCGHAQHRVCIWTTFPTSFTEGTAILPDMLLGQTSLAGTDASDGPSGVNSPRGASVSPTGQLAVGDFGNNRVLIWDNFPTAKGQAADRVLGDKDLNGNANTPAHPSTYDNRTLSGPSGVEWGANGTLLVCNATGEFVKVFDPDFFVELPNYAGLPEITPKSALVPAGVPVQLSVAKGMPPFTWAMIPNGQPEGYCPTTFDAATGIVTPGLWSIHQSDNFVPQLFTVKDSRGDVDTAELRVFPPVSARADQSPLYPGQSSYVSVSGGVSPYNGPWSFAFVENNSGGSVDPSEYGNSAYQQTYKAGNNPGKDVIEVSDSAGNKARAEVTVGTPPTVSPANPTVNRSGTIQFSFTGGIFPPDAYGRSWMMVENNTGGTIGFQDGLYTAGPIGGKDVIALHEVNGYLAKQSVTVFQPAPVITKTTLGLGKQAGGALFTVFGENFDQPLTVTVGGINATVSAIDDEKSEIFVFAPASPVAGKVDVTVSNGGGTTTLADGFEYLPEPTIASIWPAEGPKAGGNQATIYGTNLKGAMTVYIGYTPVSGFTIFEDGNSISFTVPPGSSTAAQNISVTTPGGTAGKYSAYTYISPPSISYFTPYKAPVGTTIAINGSRLSTTSGVTFNGIRADFTVISNTKVNARVPAGATTGPVVITTTGGTATRSFTVTP